MYVSYWYLNELSSPIRKDGNQNRTEVAWRKNSEGLRDKWVIVQIWFPQQGSVTCNADRPASKVPKFSSRPTRGIPRKERIKPREWFYAYTLNIKQAPRIAMKQRGARVKTTAIYLLNYSRGLPASLHVYEFPHCCDNFCSRGIFNPIEEK